MWRYACVAAGLLLLGSALAFPGLWLLNQEWMLIRTQGRIHEIEFNGRSVSNVAIIRYSLAFAVTIWIVASILFARSLFNWRRNRTIPVDPF